METLTHPSFLSETEYFAYSTLSLHLCLFSSFFSADINKVADVAHPMKPWDLHERWTKLITGKDTRQH